MIKSFQINGFRKFDNIEFKDLSRINIFLGDNNVGKTTILEGIYAATCGDKLLPLIQRSLLRLSPVNGTYDFIEKILGGFYNQKTIPLEFFFKITQDNNNSTTIKHKLVPSELFSQLKPGLNGKTINSESQSLYGNIQVLENNVLNMMPQSPIGEWEIKYNNMTKKKMNIFFPLNNNLAIGNNIMTARFTDIVSHRNQQENTMIYSCLKREKVLDEFISELSKTFGEIENIDSIPYPDGSSAPVSISFKGSELIPLYNYGDGLQRWYNILGGMVYLKNSIHCFEEVDVTFHISAQKQLSKNIVHYAKKFNNQVFMSSHSMEFVDNFLESISKEELKEVRIITLKNDDNKIKYRVLNGEEALKSREQYNLELR